MNDHKLVRPINQFFACHVVDVSCFIILYILLYVTLESNEEIKLHPLTADTSQPINFINHNHRQYNNGSD